MANKQITVRTPSGKEIDLVVDASWSPDQIRTMLRTKRPDLFAPKLPGIPAAPQVEMKESLAPKIVRGASSVLPVAGGLGGAVAGAPAFGAGGLVGGALGAAGGEAAHLALDRAIFGDDPGKLKEQLLKVGTAGAIGGASEVPGALAATIGNRVLSRIVLAKSPEEVGNVMNALLKEAPVGFSEKGLLRSLSTAQSKLNRIFGDLMQSPAAQGKSISLNTVLSPVTAEARVAELSQRGVTKKLVNVIRAAKYNAGISRGTDLVTPDELFSFQQQLQRPAYLGKPGPVQQVLKGLLKKTYGSAASELRVALPQSDSLLSQMTNLHAAVDAINSYSPTRAGAMAASAALRPRTTALVSPLVSGAAAIGSEKARKLSQTGMEALP